MEKPRISWDAHARLWYCISEIITPEERCTVFGKGASPVEALISWEGTMANIAKEKADGLCDG